MLALAQKTLASNKAGKARAPEATPAPVGQPQTPQPGTAPEPAPPKAAASRYKPARPGAGR